MDIRELAIENRSIRRFRQNVRLTRDQLLEFIDAARHAPCGANLQLLRFTPVWETELCSRVFPHLNWAGYLKDWKGPSEGERPAAYIIIQVPEEHRSHLPVDAGIAAAYIVLAARQSGFGSCMLMSFQSDPVRDAAGSPDGYGPFLIVALGAPGEKVVLEKTDGGIEYYRDERDVHHVPKLDIEHIVTR